ncbi:Src y 2 domains [Sparganum proliferum]
MNGSKADTAEPVATEFNFLPPNALLKEDGGLQSFLRRAEYIGSFLVTGNAHFERAEVVRQKLEAARRYTQSKPILLVISLQGIKVCDETGATVHMAHALRRISYATCDPDYCQFAFLAREPKAQPNIQYCHAFVTKTPEEVENLNHIVGEAFRLAYAQQRLLAESRRVGVQTQTTAIPSHDLEEAPCPQSLESSLAVEPIVNSEETAAALATNTAASSASATVSSAGPENPERGYSQDSGLSSFESGCHIPKTAANSAGRALPSLPTDRPPSPDAPLSVLDAPPLTCSSRLESSRLSDESSENETPTPLVEGKAVRRLKANRSQRERPSSQHHHHRHHRHRVPQPGEVSPKSPALGTAVTVPASSPNPTAGVFCTACNHPPTVTPSHVVRPTGRLPIDAAVASPRVDAAVPVSQPSPRTLVSNIDDALTELDLSEPLAANPNFCGRQSTPFSPCSTNAYDHATPEHRANPKITALMNLPPEPASCRLSDLPSRRFVSFSEDASRHSAGRQAAGVGGSDSGGPSTSRSGNQSGDSPSRRCSSGSVDLPPGQRPHSAANFQSKLHSPIDTEVNFAPWYQPSMPRDQVIETLLGQPPGSFIVRDSGTHANCYALSVRVGEENDRCMSASVPHPSSNSQKISHYLIQRGPNGVRLKGLDKEWPSLSCLVLHLTVMPEMLACPLRLPLSTPNPAFDQSDGAVDARPPPPPHLEQAPGLPLQHQLASANPAACFRPISVTGVDRVSSSSVAPLLPNRRPQSQTPGPAGPATALEVDEDYQRLSDFSSILADLRSRPPRLLGRSQRLN